MAVLLINSDSEYSLVADVDDEFADVFVAGMEQAEESGWRGVDSFDGGFIVEQLAAEERGDCCETPLSR